MSAAVPRPEYLTRCVALVPVCAPRVDAEKKQKSKAAAAAAAKKKEEAAASNAAAEAEADTRADAREAAAQDPHGTPSRPPSHPFHTPAHCRRQHLHAQLCLPVWCPPACLLGKQAIRHAPHEWHAGRPPPRVYSARPAPVPPVLATDRHVPHKTPNHALQLPAGKPRRRYVRSTAKRGVMRAHPSVKHVTRCPPPAARLNFRGVAWLLQTPAP